MIGWEYYSIKTGAVLRFSVLRPIPGVQCRFTLVGYTSSMSEHAGYTDIYLTGVERINVKSGDYIAVSYALEAVP